jgi:hypothetical protein
MERTNSVLIRAPRGRIFDLAGRVERWPELLPHYRWVKVHRQLAGSTLGIRRVVEMAASRDGIPVRWVAIQGLLPDAGIITFRHIRGPATGMEVAWVLRELGDGVVETRIAHRFTPAWPPPLGPWLAHHLVGGFFVGNVADKTLACIKRIAESPTAPGGRPWP